MGAGTNRPVPGPLHLAYLGDAVWELYVRRSLLAGGYAKLADLHRRAVGTVQAAAQAVALSAIEPLLTAEEKEVVRRGRNAKTHAPRGVDPLDYRYSTAFECLLGYLYYTGQAGRLEEVLQLAEEALAEADAGAGCGGEARPIRRTGRAGKEGAGHES